MWDCTLIYIGGQWSKSAEGRPADIVDPATEAVVGRVVLSTREDVDRAVAAAQAASPAAAAASRERRSELLKSILNVMLRRRQDLADAVRIEMGAPAKFAFEVQAGIGIAHVQSGIAALETYRFDRPVSGRSRVVREPIGVVGLVTPWNWPINQVMCKIVPALATGNTIVHKPSENAALSAHLIAEILDEAGMPPGIYNMVHGSGPEVGVAIAEHPGIDMVSFTGSTAAGIDVARRAAPTVKRVHQELGGKGPNIVLNDADLTRAVTENVYRLMANSGQSCHAPTRLLIPRDRMAEAAAIAEQVVSTVSVGHPASDVYMGPVASAAQWRRVQDSIARGIEEGATLVTGGLGRPAGLEQGFYVKPTVFSGVDSRMTIAREEIFGPVLSIMAYSDEDDAVAIANDSDYGLGAFVQSGTNERAMAVAARLRCGMVFINGAGEDPEAPFGGYKRSGNGREWGPLAFDDFLETKAIIGHASS